MWRCGAVKSPFTLLSTANWEPIYGVETDRPRFCYCSELTPEMRL